MTRWSDDEVQEKLRELAEMSSETLAETISQPVRNQVEAHLELDRRLKRLDGPVSLPPDFAVRVAQEVGVLGATTSLLEQRLFRVATGLAIVLGAASLSLLWGRVHELLVDSTLAAGFRGDVFVGLTVCCCAIVASHWLDRRLSRAS